METPFVRSSGWTRAGTRCRSTARTAASGEIEQEELDVLVGHELEFVLTSADATAYPRAGWTPYGLGPVVDHAGFGADLLAEAAAAGLPLE